MLPPGFLAEISRYQLLAPLADALITPPEVSVRLNPAKCTSALASGLAAALDPVPWCCDGFYLQHRPLFTFDPALHQGAYYVQDASSMAMAAVVAYVASMLGSSPLRYLDACAAPGGKTTAAISALPNGSLVVANEYDFKRAEVLAENIAKWGYPGCVVTRGDTAKLLRLPDFFDIVAVDAPCSGEGMMRKEPRAVEQWSKGLVESCAATQRTILENAWAALRPGGWLIYSTCTFNRTENEENLLWAVQSLGAEPMPLPPLDEHPAIAPGIDTPYPCYRFIPGRIRGEGLFLCAFKKPDGIVAPARIPAKKGKTKDAKISIPPDWLNADMQWVLDACGDAVYAKPAPLARDVEAVTAVLDAIMPGVPVAAIKGRDLQPTHQLALSSVLNADAFPQAEVDYPTAIAYLQRQAVSIDAPKGFVLLTYGGLPLGFVKNLGNRANNLCPKTWRIQSQQPPSSPPSLF